MQRETTCSFTGHRVIAGARVELLKEQLHTVVSALIKEGFTDFCSGGALGFDLLCAQEIIRQKFTYPHIRLRMILPCKNQDERWTTAQKEHYRQTLSLADEIIYLSENYYDGCMQKRNRYLVDSSTRILAYLERNRGGTKYTVNYAEKMGIPVLFLGETPALQLSI